MGESFGSGLRKGVFLEMAAPKIPQPLPQHRRRQFLADVDFYRSVSVAVAAQNPDTPSLSGCDSGQI